MRTFYSVKSNGRNHWFYELFDAQRFRFDHPNAGKIIVHNVKDKNLIATYSNWSHGYWG